MKRIDQIKDGLVKRGERWWRRTAIKLRQIAMPGFRGLSLYDVLRFFVTGMIDSKINLMAAAVAFNFFLSLFPLLIFTFLILDNLPGNTLEIYLNQLLVSALPVEGVELDTGQRIVQEITDQLFAETQTSVWVFFITAFLSFRWATKGFLSMTQAFARDEEVFRKRNILEVYGATFLLFFVLSGLFLFAVGVLAGGEIALSWLLNHGFLTEGIEFFGLKLLNYTISLLLLIFSVSTIYYLGPPTHQRWKFFSPGSLLASTLILFTIVGFGWFFRNFGSFNKLYGSLTAIILLMLWFYYMALLILVGFELNAAIDIAEYHQTQKKLRKKGRLKFPILVQGGGRAELSKKANVPHKGSKSSEP